MPKSWTEAVGITEHAYHLMAVFIGTVAGLFTLIGMAILIARRRLVGPVFTATTRNDKAMYVVLGRGHRARAVATVRANVVGDGYDYRETVSPWFRSLFFLQPDPSVMAGVPLGFQLHIMAAFALFAFWPFTRLVHAFSAPVGYLTRPYVVYRSRDAPTRACARRRPGWEARQRGPQQPASPERAPMTSGPDRERRSRGAALNLALATVGFLVNFWAWALLGPLGPGLKERLGLSFAAQSLLVAVPVLVGSLGRIPVGALTDRLGARVMFPVVSLATIVPVLTLAVRAVLLPGADRRRVLPRHRRHRVRRRRAAGLGLVPAGPAWLRHRRVRHRHGRHRDRQLHHRPARRRLRRRDAPFLLVAAILAVYAVVAFAAAARRARPRTGRPVAVAAHRRGRPGSP